MATQEQVRAEPANRTSRRPRPKMVDDVSRIGTQSRQIVGGDVYLLRTCAFNVVSDVRAPARNLQRRHERVAFYPLPLHFHGALRLKVVLFRFIPLIYGNGVVLDKSLVVVEPD